MYLSFQIIFLHGIIAIICTCTKPNLSLLESQCFLELSHPILVYIFQVLLPLLVYPVALDFLSLLFLPEYNIHFGCFSIFNSSLVRPRRNNSCIYIVTNYLNYSSCNNLVNRTCDRLCNLASVRECVLRSEPYYVICS